jgi:hypothetical protein
MFHLLAAHTCAASSGNASKNQAIPYESATYISSGGERARDCQVLRHVPRVETHDRRRLMQLCRCINRQARTDDQAQRL